MPKPKKPVIEYRHYSLPIDFPVLLLSGDRWRISDIKSEHLHFHNHMEIGICYSDGGIMEIKGNLYLFGQATSRSFPAIFRIPHIVRLITPACGPISSFHRKSSSVIRSKPPKVTLNRIYGLFREPIAF